MYAPVSYYDITNNDRLWAMLEFFTSFPRRKKTSKYLSGFNFEQVPSFLVEIIALLKRWVIECNFGQL